MLREKERTRSLRPIPQAKSPVLCCFSSVEVHGSCGIFEKILRGNSIYALACVCDISVFKLSLYDTVAFHSTGLIEVPNTSFPGPCTILL